jgi:hypothetical protein
VIAPLTRGHERGRNNPYAKPPTSPLSCRLAGSSLPIKALYFSTRLETGLEDGRRGRTNRHGDYGSATPPLKRPRNEAMLIAHGSPSKCRLPNQLQPTYVPTP